MRAAMPACNGWPPVHWYLWLDSPGRLLFWQGSADALGCGVTLSSKVVGACMRICVSLCVTGGCAG